MISQIVFYFCIILQEYRISSIKCTGVYFFGGQFTQRLLETGANLRQVFIFTCTNFAHFPFDAHNVSAHGESWQRLLRGSTRNYLASASFELFSATATACSLIIASYARLRLADITRAHQTGRQKTSRAPDGEVEAAGSHYMHWSERHVDIAPRPPPLRLSDPPFNRGPLSVRVEFAGSKIAITTANFG